jgi:hypothetical protein
MDLERRRRFFGGFRVFSDGKTRKRPDQEEKSILHLNFR